MLFLVKSVVCATIPVVDRVSGGQVVGCVGRREIGQLKSKSIYLKGKERGERGVQPSIIAAPDLLPVKLNYRIH